MTDTRVTIPARDVRPGDRVHVFGGSYLVRHAMTTGKKAQTTTLAPTTGDPLHYAPDTPLLVERA